MKAITNGPRLVIHGCSKCKGALFLAFTDTRKMAYECINCGYSPNEASPLRLVTERGHLSTPKRRA